MRDAADGAPILVAESDPDSGRALAEQLAADGYPVELARTAEHARRLASANPPRLAILGELGTPRASLVLLGEMRESDRADSPWPPKLPAVMVSSRVGEPDVLRAFEAGADDFLPRPASYLELRARLRAILRRTESRVGREPALHIAGLAIDPPARGVNLHGHAIELRRLEFALLLALAEDPRRVFSKDELLRSVWGYNRSGRTRTVDSHASRLRRKLDGDGSRRWVINVRGIGYRLI